MTLRPNKYRTFEIMYKVPPGELHTNMWANYKTRYVYSKSGADPVWRNGEIFLDGKIIAKADEVSSVTRATRVNAHGVTWETWRTIPEKEETDEE